ncbi:sorting nexin-17-like [Mytilus californianus]|uniref:sorting nexin-17-like n=1 Tax=Mytilus californianus TaxID=6549 RepID=UPI002246E7F4|nr:sorting nexin-17-like [Mytilus californianus]
MHFSIPDTSALKDDSGTSYTSFNVHINGVFHCSVRYSLLNAFNEELKKEFGATVLPPFPPKKLFGMTPEKLEERRLMLERYVQIVSQEPRIANSDIFNGFLLKAQQETQKETSEAVTLDVFLMNGYKITVKIMSTDQTEDVLETVASQLELPEEFTYYFTLYLVRKEEDGDNSIVRKLQEFESPYISLKYANKIGSHRIVLRKGFWDLSYEDDLLENKVAMNLLYVQAVNDIERSWTLGTKEQLKHLATLQQRGSKREYLRLVRTFKYYGYIQFKPCITDYPQADSRVLICTGGRELNFRIQMAANSVKEGSFKITRIKCWRITSSVPKFAERNGESTKPPQMELAFEYLMSRDCLQWISIKTDQAILMSMCLQSMVDELISQKQGRKIKRPHDRSKGTAKKVQLKRDNSYGMGLAQSSLPSPEEEAKGNGKNDKKGVVTNDAFSTIGDDDL